MKTCSQRICPHIGGTDFDILYSSFSTYANPDSIGDAPYYRTALKYIPENPWNDSAARFGVTP